MDSSFQQTKPDRNAKLFQVFDDTPAIKSMFQQIDQDEMNRRANDLLNANPALVADLFQRMGNTFYGPDAVFPKTVRSLSESMDSFHSVYSRNPDSLNTTVDIISDILSLDPAVMTGGVDSIKKVLAALRNWNDANGNGVIDTGETSYNWDFFGEGQELSDIGYDGVNLLIDNFDFVYELYDGAEDLDDPAKLAQTFLQTVVDDNVDVEQKVVDLMEYLENPEPGESVRDIEEEVADWMAADPDKKLITEFLISDLYPMAKDPVLRNAEVPDLGAMDLPDYIVDGDDFRNFIKRGRWLLDDVAGLVSVSPAGLSQDPDRTVAQSSDESLLAQFLADGFYNDLKLYDDLESVNAFDFSGNEILRWLKEDVQPRWNAALKLGSDPGYSQARVRELLWSGWIYQPANSGSDPKYQTNFKGIFYVDPADNFSNHGYVAKMARTQSVDLVDKAFRRQMNDIINGNNDGNYFNDKSPQAADAFKNFQLTYGRAAGQGESILESIAINLHLYLLSHYFCTVDLSDKGAHPKGEVIRKWAMTPEDGEDYFGDANRCVQSLAGGLTTALRNMAVLDENGKDPSIDPATGAKVDADAGNIPILSEMLFVIAAGYGVIDKKDAPAELTLRNCLKSMGATQLDDEGEYSLTVDGGIFGDFVIPVLGDDRIRRQSSYNPDGEQYFSTQPQMPALELLQPGTFRTRNGLAAPGAWHGKFAASQGDIIGIVDSAGNINTTNWTMTEIGLSCVQGYGPYTYQGRAANGEDRKYRNDWLSDEYRMVGNRYGDRGPGMHASRSRYHVYEAVYVPADGQTGFVASGFTNSQGARMAKYGYLRGDSASGAYTTPGTHFSLNSADANDVLLGGNRVTLDCRSREEAIRKNLFWALNQKKYMFMIPIHAYLDQNIWGGLANAKMEMFIYVTINANGILGVTRAKRFQNAGNIGDNAVWPGADSDNDGNNLDSDGDEIVSSQWIDIKGRDNCVLRVQGEGGNTYRFMGVSYKQRDFCIAVDYTYDFDTSVFGIFDLPASISEWLLNSIVNIPNEIWGSLGNGAALPEVVGRNFQSVGSLANAVYSAGDLMDNPALAESENIAKFWKFFRIYYTDAGLFNASGALLVPAKNLPPIPRVYGVKYPSAYNADGSVASWELHRGESKGKFEDITGLLATMIATMHDDGTVYADIAGTTPATYEQRARGDIAFFANNGFRAHINSFLNIAAALNDHTKNSGNRPEYNTGSWVNILVDHDHASDSTVAGYRKGVLPFILKSKYLNINHTDPIVDGLEQMTGNVVRTYFGNFKLLQGPAGDLESYYLDGDKTAVNPDINWDMPVNKARYLMSDRMLTTVERILNLVKDLSRDERFVAFMKKSIPAVNNYLYVKWLEENWDGAGTRPTRDEAEERGMFQIGVTGDDIDTFIEFVNDFEYGEFFEFVKEYGINDFERLYNFRFNNFGEKLTPTVIRDNLAKGNAMLIKYMGVNVLEGGLLGMYEIKSDPPAGFEAGETIYGYGKYVRWTESGDGNNDGTVDLSDDNGDGIVDGGSDLLGNTVVTEKGKYFLYIDAKQWVDDNRDNEARCRVVFEGITKYCPFLHDEQTEFSENCLDYTTLWYRGGMEECPNIFNLHNIDVNFEYVFDQFDRGLLEITSEDFGIRQAPETVSLGIGGKVVYRRPSTFLDWMYGWDGTSNKGLDVETEVNYAADRIVDAAYDESELTVPDPSKNMREDYTASLRTVIGDYRAWLMDNVFEYVYGADPDPAVRYEPGEEYERYSVAEEAGTHRHAINNLTEAFAELVSPKKRNKPGESNPNYVIGDLFTSWERFVEAADIAPESLSRVQEVAGNLLWDAEANDGAGDYTHFFTNLTANLPDLLREFQGRYPDLVQLGLLAFSDDGLGTYLVNVMEPDARYDSWDLVEEMNYLINTDIFTNSVDRDTFWWQSGNLLEDLAIILLRREERGEAPEPLDYFGAVHSIFQ